jgi:N6-adenosine-specific RNA methylase IME4
MTYGAILMDPPWAFETLSGARTTPHRTAEDHYPAMELYEIAGLPVPKLAARDCALFMWVVDSHLDAAFTLFDVWGFKFKTRVFTWEKTTEAGEPRIGMGYWSRKQSEICLLATVGSPRRLDKGVRELHREPRREHSRKPDEFHARIQRLVGGPYLEMFARQRRPGWDSWGNDVDKFAPATINYDEVFAE